MLCCGVLEESVIMVEGDGRGNKSGDVINWLASRRSWWPLPGNRSQAK